MSNVVEKFLRYVKIDTESDPNSKTHPSSANQLDLARLLVEELKTLGLANASLDDFGCVMAKLASNTHAPVPAIGFLAHMDTSPDLTGAGVNPQLVPNYDGGDVILNRAQSIVLSPATFPEITQYTGQTLITTDGTTLLGADDKAGVAEIMAAVEYLVTHPEVKHGDICIGFTPDEEIGQGIKYFDVKRFGADFAYTVDGGEVGSAEYETFNAAHALIRIKGRSVHPGSAKNKMVNAAQIAVELHNMLPAGERPESTEGYEGFFHLTHLRGSIEEAELHYIIRDHDRQKFEARKALIQNNVAVLNDRYGQRLSLEMGDSYYNMREIIEPVKSIFEAALQAIRAVGLTPTVSPVRGGTDGSQLSFMGLPTPNIFTGGHNAHGRFEYIPAESMEKAVEVIVKIVEIYAAGGPA
jgi:tripeptide aminopeptidase